MAALGALALLLGALRLGLICGIAEVTVPLYAGSDARTRLVSSSTAWMQRGLQTPAPVLRIQLIRNAICVIRYGGRTLLLDPFLSDAGALPAFNNTPESPSQSFLVHQDAKPAGRLTGAVPRRR